MTAETKISTLHRGPLYHKLKTTNSKYYKCYVNDAFSGINRMNAVVRDQTSTKPNCYLIPYMYCYLREQRSVM
jgi:hypothetical protein